MNLSLEKLNITKLTGLHIIQGGYKESTQPGCETYSDLTTRTVSNTHTETATEGPSEGDVFE